MTSFPGIMWLPLVISLALTACGGGTGPTRQIPINGTSPTSPSGAGGLTTPVPVSPVNGQQLSTLRPTLTVQNATSSQSGARTYEFQISDRSDFTLEASLTASFVVAVNQTGVAEGPDGRTQFTVSDDLQPTTRMYWRARAVQGSTTSAWTTPASFKTKLVGYNRPGELYDPLIHGETVGTRVGATTFVTGKGIRLENESAYVMYALGQTLTSGEFSVEVEGLQVGDPGEKLKIFSMQNGTGNLLNSPFLMNVQYRGASDANPDNSISFKMQYGNDSTRKFEPDKANRKVVSLSASRTYFWKATWGSEVRLLVQNGLGGTEIYNYGIPTTGTYNPTPHYAYLGANNRAFGSSEGGSRPGAVIRNVWISDKPRPASLGSALE